MNIGEKLKRAREYKGVSQTKVYEDIGINNKTLSGYERNISEPDLKTLELLSRYYEVSIDYFLGQTNEHDSGNNKFGKYLQKLRQEKGYTIKQLSTLANIEISQLERIENGFMHPTVTILKRISPYLDVSYEKLCEKAVNVQYTIGEVDDFLLRKKVVPILGSIRAGVPVLAQDNWEEEIESPSHFEADFALRVEGNSMFYAGIHQGDIALFCKTNHASHGQIVAAGIEEDVWQANLKFYIRQNGHACLRSANPDYEDIELTEKHRIIGVLVGVIKEPPSLMEYQTLLQNKDYQDKEWTDLIEFCSSKGLGASEIKHLVEFHSVMVKQFKKNP